MDSACTTNNRQEKHLYLGYVFQWAQFDYIKPRKEIRKYSEKTSYDD